MIIAIAVLFALYATGFSKADNKPRHGLKTRRAQREVENELNTQETTHHKNSVCAHKFGYLKTHKDQGVPEECVGCTRLVQCLIPDK